MGTGGQPEKNTTPTAPASHNSVADQPTMVQSPVSGPAQPGDAQPTEAMSDVPVPPSEPAGTAIPVANHDIVDTFWDIPPITFPTDLYDAGGAGVPSGPRPPQSAALPPASYAMCTSCTATCRPPGYPSSESVTGQPVSIDICHNVRK